MRTRSNAVLSASIATVFWVACVVPGGLPAAHASGAECTLGESAGAVSGAAAISALDERLDEVAAAHQMSPDQLEQALRDDPSLHLDRTGRLFYVDPIPQTEGVTAAAAETVSVAALPLESTFALHSRPGATKVIFLDFDGHVLSGTAWSQYLSIPSAYTAPAYDTDGSPSTFGDAERRLIQEVWQRVAEDYLPFDVDVTTEQPPETALSRASSADQQYGTRALISPIGQFDPGHGGRAFLGVFNRVNYEYYKPALVYSDALGSAKSLGEAVSHEVGHNLYLVHDGTPDNEYHRGDGTGWGPVMGAPYGSPLTQWSAGTYAGATSTQDDLEVIAWSGPGYRADDHVDSTSQATTMTAGSTAAASGVIERTVDVDVLRFSASGTDAARLTASPAAVGANLTILLELLDSSGVVIQSATSNSLRNPATNAVIQTGVLAAGTYFVRVSGVANGDSQSADATDYGSLGAWSLTVSQSSPVVLEPVYRFYNTRLGTHFYTASQAERDRVIATLAHIYAFEGEAYRLNPANNAVPLYRFYNPATGTHFYTASESEKNRVQSTLARVYRYEGPAYAVSLDSGGGVKQTVWRFYNRRTGTHFYTADAGEMNRVKQRLSDTYTYEGPAYYLGQ